MFCLVFLKVKEVEFDYSPWLGEGYKCLPPNRCGLLVGNHCSFFDPDLVIRATKGYAGFAAAEWTKTIPIYGKFIAWLEGDYVTRAVESQKMGTINRWMSRA